jgi:DNA-binding LytR/AlgR family response regulator
MRKAFQHEAHEIRVQKTITREMFVQPAGEDNVDVSAGSRRADMIFRQSRSDYILESPAECGSREPADTTDLSITSGDATKPLTVQQFDALAKRQASRIAFKAKGRFLFLDLAEVVALKAEGNYVSLQHPPNSHLLRESLSSIAEKLKPYGFIRIHRSVLVNISAVEQVQPLPTGEYRLCVKGGKEYLVTRTYKNSLRDLAQVWVGSERLCR